MKIKQAYPEEDITFEAIPGSYTSASYRLISDYCESGWEAQRMIQELYEKRDLAGLEALANYADTMSLRKEDNNIFLFEHVKTQPNYTESVKKTQKHFSKAFRDAAEAVKLL
tara:strand:+ start:793 stop:1128 length:336 start_codon:yes stop_codon:yes gene_type:complete